MSFDELFELVSSSFWVPLGLDTALHCQPVDNQQRVCTSAFDMFEQLFDFGAMEGEGLQQTEHQHHRHRRLPLGKRLADATEVRIGIGYFGRMERETSGTDRKCFSLIRDVLA